MIDLEKELKAFEKYNGRPPHSPDEDAEFYGWLERARLAKAEQEKLEAEVNKEREEATELFTECEYLKQTIESLKAQLAQYQSDDYVLVPRKPTMEMLNSGLESVCNYLEHSDVSAIYNSMLKAGVKP